MYTKKPAVLVFGILVFRLSNGLVFQNKKKLMIILELKLNSTQHLGTQMSLSTDKMPKCCDLVLLIANIKIFEPKKFFYSKIFKTLGTTL